MAEKDTSFMLAAVAGNEAAAAGKTVPMKLFASWEIEKTSANCVPRLCMFTVTNLRITGNLDDDVQSVILAVQMEGSKRVLRSGDIKLPSAAPGSQDISLDLSFSLQYAHFLKRDMNNLQVVMQRRKKYKNRTMLGYKSLAAGVIDLSKVLQSPADYCLKLVACQRKEQRVPGAKPTVAELSILNITSKPIMVSEDQVTGGRKPALSGTEHSPESEEEDGSGDDDAENDDVSDEEMAGQASNRRNLKERFIAMIRRFKTADDGEMGMAPHGARNQQSLDRLFDELENLSDDSDAAEVDNLSVLSVPKPRLRPYFKDGSTGDMANLSEGEGDAVISTAGATAEAPTEVPSAVSRSEAALLVPTAGSRSPAAAARHGKNGASEKGPALAVTSESKLLASKEVSAVASVDSGSADKSALSHSMSSDWAGFVEKVFTTVDDRLPSLVLLLDERVDSPHRTVSQHLLLSLQHDYARHAVQASSETDVGVFVAAAAAAIQRQCNNIPRLSNVVKVVLLGDDSFFNLVLRPFVRVFSDKSPDWLNYIRFIPVPLGHGASSSQLCKHLGTIDSYYFSTFCDGVWTERLDHYYGQSFITDDPSEMLLVLKQYVSAAAGTLQFPISEAMIARHSDSHKDEKESQVFVPFLTEVKIGSLLNAIPQPEYEGESTVQLLSVSPGRDGSTVPAGPPTTVFLSSSGNDPTELQLDYWLAVSSLPAPIRTDGSDPSGMPVQLQAQQLQQQQQQTLGPSQAQTLQGPQQQQVQQQQLQLPKGDKKSSSGSTGGGTNVSSKVTLKSFFKFVNVVRSISRNAVMTTFSLYTLSKEKKKMIRLGKKNKDKDEKEKTASKHATVEGICRLVCTSKDQSDTLKATIDGVEWKKIHFFQLSTQWQSHVKYLPLAISRQTVEA